MPRDRVLFRTLGWSGLLAGLLFLAACSGSGRAARDTAASDTTQAAADTVRPTPPVVPTTVPIQSRPPVAATQEDAAVTPGRFDLGRMWTFDYPPTAYFREAYGLDADPAWFERARLGALRFATYCSASFVSPYGLVMTNHHCARESIVTVTRAGENLLDAGFYADGVAGERAVEELFVDQLIDIRDVSDEVFAAESGATTDQARAEARTAALRAITERVTQEAGGEEAGVVVQVVSLYQGGRYSAYTFRRYDDVRLVMAPEHQIAYYGGDYDNFTYPRYSLDMAFFRVYGPDGRLLPTQNYFRWSEEGAEAGEPVFVVGNPGSTFRLETVAQLEYRRDVSEPGLLAYIAASREALEAYNRESPSDSIRTQILSLLNSEKAYTGRLEGLRSPDLIARRRAEEQQFLQALRADTELNEQYGNVLERLAALQQERRRIGTDYRAFVGLAPGSIYSSATLRRAIVAYNFLTQRGTGQGGGAEALREQLAQVASQPPGADERLLAARLRLWQDVFSGVPQLVSDLLQGRTPEERAREIVSGTVLTSIDRTVQAFEAGTLTVDSDPALRLAGQFVPRYRTYQGAAADIAARQEALLAQIGRARFEVSGTEAPPDATFSLRIADGIVAGYPNNGTIEPHQTTYFGLYGQYHSYNEYTEEWDLPQRWLNPPPGLDLETPMNFVSTNDIIGGNSGSPVLNGDLEVVGLAFDGNIQSLANAYIFRTEDERTVSVDSRGMIEALDEMYDADRIVQELTEGRLYETEAEADAATRTSSRR